MVVTLGQEHNVSYINRHAGAPSKTKTKDTMSLDYSSITLGLGSMGVSTIILAIKQVNTTG